MDKFFYVDPPIKQKMQKRLNLAATKNKDVQSQLQKTDYDGYAQWQSIATKKSGNSMTKVKTIITGCKVWMPTPVDESILNEWRNQEGVALDFGCGLGRNAPMLRENFARVVGYDLQPMLDMLQTDKDSYTLYDLASSDLKDIFDSESITTIFESVVWQHIKWESKVVQTAIDLITTTQTVNSIYTCWNAAVLHQSDAIEYLKSKGWTVTESGQVAQEYLNTIGNVPHNWYYLTRSKGDQQN